MAPIGKPPAIPLAQLIASGWTSGAPSERQAHQSPVRPKPHCTSSNISSRLRSSHSRRSPRRNSAVAGVTPLSPWIGSSRMAAVRSVTAAFHGGEIVEGGLDETRRQRLESLAYLFLPGRRDAGQGASVERLLKGNDLVPSARPRQVAEAAREFVQAPRWLPRRCCRKSTAREGPPFRRCAWPAIPADECSTDWRCGPGCGPAGSARRPGADGRAPASKPRCPRRNPGIPGRPRPRRGCPALAPGREENGRTSAERSRRTKAPWAWDRGRQPFAFREKLAGVYLAEKRTGATGDLPWRGSHFPPVTVYPSARKSSASPCSISAATWKGIGLKHS